MIAVNRARPGHSAELGRNQTAVIEKDVLTEAEATHQYGYEPNTRFNSLTSATRLIVSDNVHGRQVDVFVGSFRTCHSIPITDRLELDPRTIPLAELLLTKLQITKLNDKDVKDILAVMVEHEVSDHDDDTVNADYIAGLLAADAGTG
jgi:hypothetical protein